MHSGFNIARVPGPVEDICYSNMVLSYGMLSTRGERANDSRSTAALMPRRQRNRGAQELGASPGTQCQTQKTVQAKKKKKNVVGSQDWNGAGWKNSLPPFSFLLCEQPSALRAEPHRLRESRTDGENTWADGEERVFSRWSLCTCFDLEHTAVRVTVKLQTESSKDAPKTAICKNIMSPIISIKKRRSNECTPFQTLITLMQLSVCATGDWTLVSRRLFCQVFTLFCLPIYVENNQTVAWEYLDHVCWDKHGCIRYDSKRRDAGLWKLSLKSSILKKNHPTGDASICRSKTQT